MSKQTNLNNPTTMAANGLERKSMFSKIKTTAQIAALLLLAPASSVQALIAHQAPVTLGSTANFAVLAGSTVTSIGATDVTGDLGLWPGSSVAGFPPGKVNGNKHVADPAAKTAQGDLTTAFNDAAGRSTAPVSISGNIGGQTLAPGLYKSTSGLEISSGDLTLDGQGDPNAVFIFQMATTLITTAGRQVVLIGGAQAANVFWQVGTSATIGTSSGMKGTIMADQSISIKTGATLQGRALARIGGVTLQGNVIVVPSNGGLFEPSTNLFVSGVSAITFNAATGLFEQTVRVTNGGSGSVNAARLIVRGVPLDVQVYDASGSLGGTPFLQYNLPIPAGATVRLHFNYFRRNRQNIPQPDFVVQETNPIFVGTMPPFTTVNSVTRLRSGRFLVVFSAKPWRRYVVQYSADRQNWKSATPIITASSTQEQFHDDGPPRTDSKPDASRSYRVMLLP
jgi:hypothetical protein